MTESLLDSFRRLQRRHESWCDQHWQDELWSFQLQHDLTDEEIEALEEAS